MLSRKNLFRYEHFWTQTSEVLLSRSLNEQSIRLPPPLADKVAQAQERWQRADNTRRLWSKDATLWTGHDEAAWLGWLDIIDGGPAMLAPLREFAGDVRAKGFSDVLLLGMGGSSLGPDVLAKSLGAAPGYPALRVLDSTDPEQVAAFRGKRRSGAHAVHRRQQIRHHARAECADGLFFCARHRRGRKRGREPLRRHYRSGLAAAEDRRAERLRPHLLRHPSIGGRYSVLSPFGLVPLAALGRDVGVSCEDARAMARTWVRRTSPRAIRASRLVSPSRAGCAPGATSSR